MDVRSTLSSIVRTSYIELLRGYLTSIPAAGSGSALLDSAGKLGRIITGMNRALGEIPVTVKLRTGIKDNHNVAHKLMPRASAEWGAGCITVSRGILRDSTP